MELTPNAICGAINANKPVSWQAVTIAANSLNELIDELGRIHAALLVIDMATSALPLDQQSAIQQVNGDAMDRVAGVMASLSDLKAPTVSALSAMSATELLEANKTALAVRQVFNLQATRFRFRGATGGEQVRSWASRQVHRLDEEIFAIVMELDNRDMTGDQDAEHERDIAIQESYDVLPFGNAFEVRVCRRSAK